MEERKWEKHKKSEESHPETAYTFCIISAEELWFPNIGLPCPGMFLEISKVNVILSTLLALILKIGKLEYYVMILTIVHTIPR